MCVLFIKESMLQSELVSQAFFYGDLQLQLQLQLQQQVQAVV